MQLHEIPSKEAKDYGSWRDRTMLSKKINIKNSGSRMVGLPIQNVNAANASLLYILEKYVLS